MKRVLVIADDLSGAAEVAGVAVRHGLKTVVLRKPFENLTADCSVIDTDSRGMSEVDAGHRVAEWAGAARNAVLDLVYKKTDSVLRGPVAAEVAALMRALGKRSALLVPQNPSRGRVIRGGKYYIGDVPLDQTEFARDPDHPAQTSDVRQMVSDVSIAIGEGDSAQDLRDWANCVNPDILPAGGAEFFAALLKTHGLHERAEAAAQPRKGSMLIACGSASASSQRMIEQARDASVPICAMPDEVGGWADAITGALAERSRALMMIPQPIDRHQGVGARLRAVMAETVAAVLARCGVGALYIAGGATASAICERMGWSEFEATVHNGMVELRAQSGPRVVIQPGSYAWPQWVFSGG